MKQCSKCNINQTIKWYSGPLCRQCYRKDLHKDPVRKLKSNIKSKEWRNKNKEYALKKNKEWVIKNYITQLMYQKEYRIKNKDKKRTWEKQDRLFNINRRIADNLRNRLKMALKNNQKTGSAVSDLGCSISQLKQHLESKFQKSMSWENYGRKGWHIDHIRPLSRFDLSNPEEFHEACHYTNLQPLWAKDNLSKGNRYET